MATFEEIHTLIQLVSEHSQQPLPLLGKLERQTGKETTLFENIRNGHYTNDMEAAADLYDNSIPDKRYTMLKSRLYQKLLNQLLFLNFNDPRFARYAVYEQECLTLLHQARLLLHSANPDLAEDLLKRSLKTAKELKFTGICVECLQEWRSIYVKNGQVEEFRKNQQQLNYFRAIAEYEQEAEDLFQLVRLEMKRPVHIRKKFLSELPAILDKLKEFWERHHSASVFRSYYLLNIWYCELTGNFAEIIRITSESQVFLGKGLVNPLHFDERYNKYIQVYAYLKNREYEVGLLLAKEYLPIIHSATPNWFSYMENYFLMALHAKQYHLATQLLEQVYNNRFIWKITPSAKEKWTLYRAYLFLIHPPDKLPEAFDKKIMLRDISYSAKDKQGFNINVLLLQCLYELQTGDLEVLQYRIENLKQYSKRYLVEQNARRSRLFIRLLALVVMYQLDVIICRKKGASLLSQLTKIPTSGDAFAEIEIVPYEHLWEWVLSNIRQQNT